jgi:hypothetical protein
MHLGFHVAAGDIEVMEKVPHLLAVSVDDVGFVQKKGDVK